MAQVTAQVPSDGVRAGLNSTGSTIAKGTFVKLLSTAAQRIGKAGAGELVFGVTMQDIADGAYGDVQVEGKAIVLAGDTVALAAVVASDASGLAVTAAEGDITAGSAATAGAAAGYMEVHLAGPGGGYVIPAPPPPPPT